MNNPGTTATTGMKKASNALLVAPTREISRNISSAGSAVLSTATAATAPNAAAGGASDHGASSARLKGTSRMLAEMALRS